MTYGVALMLSALGVLAALLFAQLVPKERAVRARNAMLLEASGAGDFVWNPPDYPAGFKVETMPADREFMRIVEALRIAAPVDDFRAALAIAAHLTEHVEDTGPVRADPLTTYRAIREGRGYCADFVKVFLVLAHVAGLAARRWAFSFDGFGGHGHTVVEVFDRQRGRWLMLDVYNNFHVVDAATGEPLGVLEYRDALLGRRAVAAMRPNGPGRLGFVHAEKAIAYYRRGIHQWYLVWGNDVMSNYAHAVVRTLGRSSPALGHLAANVFGVQPRIHIYATPENVAEVRSIFRLRRVLHVTIGAIVALAILLAVHLVLVASGHRGALASNPGMARGGVTTSSWIGEPASPSSRTRGRAQDGSAITLEWVPNRA